MAANENSPENKPPQFFSIYPILVTSIIALLTLIVLVFTLLPPVQAQIQGQGQVQTITGFFTNITANQEVPPTDSNATGIGVFLFKNDSSELSYLVNTTGLEKISQSKMYNGSAGINGEPIAPLSGEKATNGKMNSPILFEGEIKKDDLNGIFNGKDVTDLVNHMSNDSTYVNIHTEQYPDGVIRGQIVMGQVQLEGDAITGLLVPGGIIGLSGVSLQGGVIVFTQPGIAGFIPGNSQTGNENDNTVGNVVDGAGGVVGDVIDTAAGVVTQAGKTVGDTVGYDGGNIVNVEDNDVGNVETGDVKIDEGTVEKLLDDDDDGNDSDGGDSKDDDDDGDSKDDDDDGDSKDDDDDGDSVKDKVDGLLS